MPNTQAGFQTFVNDNPPVAFPGDFSSANPRASVLAGDRAYVTAPGGVVSGCFAWADPVAGVAANYYQPNSFLGFIHREMLALITQFLGYSGSTVLPGHGVTVMQRGDFWANFIGPASVGQKVYADPSTGLASANATGNSVSANSTAASVANTGIMTVGATLTGALAVGQAVYVAGLPAGTTIGSQLTGSAGSTGTYQLVNNSAPIASGSWPVISATTINMAGVQETTWTVASAVPADLSLTTSSIAATGILTVGGGGTPAAGMFLSGTGLSGNANAQILYKIDATHFQTNYFGVVASTTLTATQGRLAMITNW